VLSGQFYLSNVLVTPDIIKNLLSVRQFTTDNNCSMEFDPFGLSVKDLNSRNTILRCNNSGPLYTISLPTKRAPPATTLLLLLRPYGTNTLVILALTCLLSFLILLLFHVISPNMYLSVMHVS
jgi:hypothetical protein